MGLMEGVVGLVRRGLGGSGPLALTQQGALAVAQTHAKYYEAVRRGNVFHATTAVTGVAPGTAIGTTAAFALYNPANSKANVSILRASLAYLSGTLGIGFVHWVGHLDPNQAAFSGTAITPVNAEVAAAAAKAKPLTTATVPSGGVVLKPFCNLPPMLATSVLAPWLHEADVDGEIVIPPGAGISLQATAGAGTSPLVVYGVTWEEIPLLSA